MLNKYSFQHSFGIRAKLILLFLTVALLPMLVLGLFSYFQAKQALFMTTTRSLEALAAEQEARFEDLARIYQERLDLLPAGTNLSQLAEQYRQTGQTDQARMASILTTAKQTINQVDEISLLGFDGTVLASTTTTEVGQNRAAEGYFKNGQAGILRPEVFSRSDGRLTTRLSGPLRRGDQTVGVLVLTYPAVFLQNVANDYSGLGGTGEYVVYVRNANGNPENITPFRSDPAIGLHREFRSGDAGLVANQALQNQERTFTDIRDYRGHQVVAATRYLDQFDWGLVVKIDRDEVLAPATSLRRAIWLLAAVMAVLITLVIVQMSYLFTRPLLRIASVTRLLGRGKLAERVRLSNTDDEIGRLGESINLMADQLQASHTGLARRAEQHRGRLAAIVQTSTDAIISTDLTGKILSWNAGAGRIYGYESTEVLNQSLAMLASGGSLQDPERLLARVAKGRPVEIDHDLHRTKNGQTIHTSLAISPLRDKRRVSGAALIIRDITAQHEIYEMQRDFVSIASHELRTPITALQGYLALLREQVSGKSEQFLDRAGRAANRLQALVEDLLNVTRIEEGRLKLHLGRINPRQAIEEAVAGCRSDAEAKGVTVTFDNKLPATTRIRADQGRLEQVLVNLIDNAIKYTPDDGTVTVTAASRRRQVEIAVADTGIGIHPDNLQNIFDKFYREHTPLSVEAGGTGLGLFITRELVERMDGGLSIRSKQGKGTTVKLTFPKVDKK